MKTKSALTLLLSFLCLFLGAQNSSIPAIIEFTDGGYAIDRSVEQQIEQVYDAAHEGIVIELILLSAHERRKTDGFPERLSKLRGEQVQIYLNRIGASPNSILVNCRLSKWDVRKTFASQESAFDGKGLYTISITKEREAPLVFSRPKVDPFADKYCETAYLSTTERGMIYCMNGLMVEFTPRSLEYENGLPLDCDEVEVSVCEFLDREEAILADLTTSSGKKMLESGGMLHIKATCNGEAVRLKKNMTVKISVPAENPKEDMQVFHGKDRYNTLDWERSIASDIEVVSENEAIEDANMDGVIFSGEYEEGNILDGYILQSTNLGWINCDRFYEIEEPVELFVSTDKVEKVGVRMIFRNINSLMPAYYCSDDKKMKFSGVPKGESVVVIAYKKRENTVFFASQELILGEELNLDMTLSEISNTEFKDLIAGFAQPDLATR